MKVKVAEYLHPKDMMRLAMTARANHAPSTESAMNYYRRLGKGEMANLLHEHHRKMEAKSKTKRKEHTILEKLKPEFSNELEFLKIGKYDLDKCVAFLKQGGSPDLNLRLVGNIVVYILYQLSELYESNDKREKVIQIVSMIPSWITRRNAKGVVEKLTSNFLQESVYLLSQTLTENDKETAKKSMKLLIDFFKLVPM